MPRSFHAVSPDARWRSVIALTNVGVTLFWGLVPGASEARLFALFVDPASNAPVNPCTQLVAPVRMTLRSLKRSERIDQRVGKHQARQQPLLLAHQPRGITEISERSFEVDRADAEPFAQ